METFAFYLASSKKFPRIHFMIAKQFCTFFLVLTLWVLGEQNKIGQKFATIPKLWIIAKI